LRQNNPTVKPEASKAIAEYRKIRASIQQKCTRLHNLHHAHLQCRKGCDSCCINFSVFPVEFFSILTAISSNPPQLNNENHEQCLFLVNQTCQIYEHRPSICRSHGLPILNMDETGEQWELSYCQLNFKTADESYFTLENGFKQDYYNSKLFLINREFLAHSDETTFSETDLIDLRKMKEYLK
jgi:uncharacterized protein